ALGETAGREHRVVAADRGEIADLELREGCQDGIELRGFFGRIGACGVENRAALEVDTRHLVVIQELHFLRVARHQPLKAVEDADDLAPAIARLESERADDAVDARRRSAADWNAYPFVSSALRAGHNFTAAGLAFR